jgi:uncharacterized phosphosugar-binding protein
MDSPASAGANTHEAVIEAARKINAPAMRAVQQAADTLVDLAERIVEATADGHQVFAFGAGHADMFAMELYSRAGGLRLCQIMHLTDLDPQKRPFGMQMRDSEPERDPANGAELIRHYGIANGDIVLIASNSGRNGAAVELALRCRDLGAFTAAFTSVAHSQAVASRHPSGKRLLDVADVVVDNCCPLGDAVLSDPRVNHAFGATSSLSFCLLAQALNVAVVRTLADRHLPVEVLVSANL